MLELTCTSDANGSGIVAKLETKTNFLLELTGRARVTLIEREMEQSGEKSLLHIPSFWFSLVPPIVRAGKGEMLLAQFQH